LSDVDTVPVRKLNRETYEKRNRCAATALGGCNVSLVPLYLTLHYNFLEETVITSSEIVCCSYCYGCVSYACYLQTVLK